MQVPSPEATGNRLEFPVRCTCSNHSVHAVCTTRKDNRAEVIAFQTKPARLYCDTLALFLTPRGSSRKSRSTLGTTTQKVYQIALRGVHTKVAAEAESSAVGPSADRAAVLIGPRDPANKYSDVMRPPVHINWQLPSLSLPVTSSGY